MRVLDRRRTALRYGNGSEFVRDLLRAELVKEEWAHEEGETAGADSLTGPEALWDHKPPS